MKRKSAAPSEDSDLFFEKVLSQLQDYVCIWNRHKQCVYANDKLERLWGLTREGYMWKTPTQLAFSPEGSGLFERNIERVVDTGKAVTDSFPYAGAGADPCHYQCLFNPVLSAEGDIEFVACVTRDVTERIRAEEALKESERQYQLLFESLEEAFCLLNVVYDQSGEPRDFKVLKVNPAFVKHTGINDPVGKSTRDLVPELEEKWMAAWGKVAKSGEPVCLVEESTVMGRWFDACIYSLEGPRSSRIVLLFYDITKFVF